MKRILLFSLLSLLLLGAQAYSACLLEQMQKGEYCTGGASDIINSDKNSNQRYKNKELQDALQPPTMSVPYSIKQDGFPIMNQNCMNGVCLPDLR